MNHKTLLPAAAIALLVFSHAAVADIHTLSDAPWTRPTTLSGATASQTTYQLWTSILTGGATAVPGPNAPTTNLNPNGTANAYDATAGTDGAFAAGGDIYSFSGIITPAVSVPGYAITGNQLNVQAQVQSFGSVITASDLSVAYTDPTTLTPVTTQVSNLANYGYTQTYNDGGSDFGGFGTAYTVDGKWNFTLPADVSTFKLTWGWDVVSSGFEGLAIDTQSVPAATSVPEPASLCLLSGSVALLLCGRRRPTR